MNLDLSLRLSAGRLNMSVDFSLSSLREYKNQSIHQQVDSVRVCGAKREDIAYIKPLAEAMQKIVEARGYKGAEIVVLSEGEGMRTGVDSCGRPYLAISEDLLKCVKPSDIERMPFEDKSKSRMSSSATNESESQNKTPASNESTRPEVQRAIDRPEVQRAIDKQLANRKEIENLFRIYDTKYKSLFEKKLREAGLPVELGLLTIVGSALREDAISRGGAAGLWQLIPATAEQYGLKVDTKAVEEYKKFMAKYNAVEAKYNDLVKDYRKFMKEDYPKKGIYEKQGLKAEVEELEIKRKQLEIELKQLKRELEKLEEERKKRFEELKSKDERFDVEKATEAAVKFLEHLYYERFNGNLDKVIAAYNAGPNNKAFQELKERGLDFWTGKHFFLEETQKFVQSVYATIILYNDRQKYGLLEEKRKSQEAKQELLEAQVFTPSL